MQQDTGYTTLSCNPSVITNMGGVLLAKSQLHEPQLLCLFGQHIGMCLSKLEALAKDITLMGDQHCGRATAR